MNAVTLIIIILSTLLIVCGLYALLSFFTKQRNVNSPDYSQLTPPSSIKIHTKNSPKSSFEQKSPSKLAEGDHEHKSIDRQLSIPEQEVHTPRHAFDSLLVGTTSHAFDHLHCSTTSHAFDNLMRPTSNHGLGHEQSQNKSQDGRRMSIFNSDERRASSAFLPSTTRHAFD